MRTSRLLRRPDPRSDSGPAAAAGPSQAGSAVRAVDLRKAYGTGDTAVHALAGVTVDFHPGQFHAVMGPSGSGKSTLMHVLAGLDRPTSGSVVIDGTEIAKLDDGDLTQLRRDKIGFIFQAFNLIPTLNTLENITLPLDLAGAKPDRDWLDTVVAAVGLGDRLSHRPSELSGGQQQRVAVARALATRPQIVFADEPTGNLDSRASGEILAFMARATAELGQTIVMVTHDAVAASHSGRVVFLADGRISDEMADPTAQRILDRIASLGD